MPTYLSVLLAHLFARVFINLPAFLALQHRPVGRAAAVALVALGLTACLATPPATPPADAPAPDSSPVALTATPENGTPGSAAESAPDSEAAPSAGDVDNGDADDSNTDAREPARTVARQSTPTAHALPAIPGLAPRRVLTGTRTMPTPAAGSIERLLPTPTVTPRATATPRPTPTPRLPRISGTTTAPTVNLRGGPGTNYPVQGQIRAGDPVFQIVGRNEAGTWLQICCPTGDDARVWISADFVEATLPRGVTLTALPIPDDIPAPQIQPVAGPRPPNRSAADFAGAPAVGLPGPGDFAGPGSTNPLTGQPLPGGRNNQRPLIVCINNDYAARPQLGTSQADIMYEYLMEGYGITRMSGIYYGSEAAQIGPARSARLINYYLGALYDAATACTGASDPVRYSLKHDAPFPYLDFDLDDPNANRYSTSVGTDYRTRMRTSTAGLRRWLAEWNIEKAPAIRSLTFGNAPGGGAAATSITIPYPSGTGSQVSYRYSNGRYLRNMGGGAHVDGATGAQLAFDNVVVQFVTHEATNIVEDSLGSTSIRLNLFGSNRALVFRDGQAFTATWRSESRGDLPRFYDASGNEIPLKPGRTFFSIVPESYTITYQ